ncbi:DUF5339 domain-containing protein [Pseudoxanthomonas japonensis]|uniref:Glutaconyl-CoA decarboxylase subunit gamma n=1 Tax=Pseudoxanthomonas japonensis TaxID=69284 RepID=A0ABQ6ZL04_9GAMM|nr:DUF5339 domain-containing protein [Pseudoxanthomonas japonensis]KAF1726942.1 hypothetical protein CSC78_02235 [Pseudoxanthomonas japonensis]
MKFNILALAALTTLALAACKPAEEATPVADAPAVEAPAVEAPAVEAPAATEAVAATTDTVEAGTGVPECDQYLEKVYACISDKVPEAQREMMKQGIEQSKAGWAALTDKTALAAQCKTAMDQAKTAYAAMGCSF